MKRVRAIIIKDDKILLMKRGKGGRTYWVFPGGLAESGETDSQALIREVKEEMGVTVALDKLLLQMKSKKPEARGDDEYFYLCRYLSGEAGTGQGPEYQPNSGYIGTYEPEWVAVKDMDKLEVLPEEVKNLVLKNYQ